MKKWTAICFLTVCLGANAWAALANYGLLNTGAFVGGGLEDAYAHQTKYTIAGTNSLLVYDGMDDSEPYMTNMITSNAFVIAGADFNDLFVRDLLNLSNPNRSWYVPNTADAQWISPLNPGGTEAGGGFFINAKGSVTFTLTVNVPQAELIHVDFAGGDYVQFFLNDNLISTTTTRRSLTGVNVTLGSGDNFIKFVVTNDSQTSTLFVRSSDPYAPPIPDAGSTLLLLGCVALGLGLAKRK